MHSLSPRHTSGLYRKVLCFGQSVETLAWIPVETPGQETKGELKLKSLLQVKHISGVLTGFQINLDLK